MKLLFLTLLLCPFIAFAQENSEDFLREMREKSLTDLQEIVGPEVADEMVPLSANVNKGKLYIMWGYHTGKHTRSDVTFKTPDGTFTMYDVKGVDSPSTKLRSYIDPTKFTQPQYNLRFGYMITNKIAIEVGTDHMKWVMDLSGETYKTSGEYHRLFWNENGSFTLEQLQASGYNPPIHLEHTDGYNYVNAGVVYYQNLFSSYNQRWSVDAGVGTGGGMLVTKTNIYIADGLDGSVRHNDNAFQVAGYGFHADARLRVSYKTRDGKQFFLMGTARGVYGKVNNAPFLDNYGGSIEHSGMYSLQTGIMGGVSIPVLDGSRKKKKQSGMGN